MQLELQDFPWEDPAIESTKVNPGNDTTISEVVHGMGEP